MTLLKDKTALITGGGQGIGQGIALALAKKGAKIVVTGRTLEKCAETVRQIEALGSEAVAVRCDVKSEEDLKVSADKTILAFGQLDILVNNAQEVPTGPLNQITDEVLNAGWESGPLATFRMMKICYPHLKNGGHIINILSSVMKRWDMRNYGGYAAVKAAIQQLTRAAACEWGAEGIRVNAIMPHAKSPALNNWMQRNPEEAEAFQAGIPLKRVGECEDDIGAFVALMCSNEASYLSGQTIALDGGQVFIG